MCQSRGNPVMTKIFYYVGSMLAVASLAGCAQEATPPPGCTNDDGFLVTGVSIVDGSGSRESPDTRTYTYAEASAQKAIPLGLATGGQATRDIAKGDLLTEENFAPNPEMFVYKLRRMQDAQLTMDA